MCEALNGVNRLKCSRTPTISVHSVAEMSVEVPQVTMTPADVPGADLCEPYDKHTVPPLRLPNSTWRPFLSRCHNNFVDV